MADGSNAPERRKNPARKRAEPVVSYQIEWTPEEGRWNVFQNGMKTGEFSRDKKTAIEHARKLATADVQTERKAVIFLVQEGEVSVVWRSP